MTTCQIPENRQSKALTDAVSLAIKLGDLEAQRPLTGVRTAADPGNTATVANVAWAEHVPVARALRRAAEHLRSAQPEGPADPIPGQLEDVAGQLDQNLALRRANGG